MRHLVFCEKPAEGFATLHNSETLNTATDLPHVFELSAGAPTTLLEQKAWMDYPQIFEHFDISDSNSTDKMRLRL